MNMPIPSSHDYFQRRPGYSFHSLSEEDHNLTPADFDWLRQMQGAADAKRDPPPAPGNIIDKLGGFGFVKPEGLGGFSIMGVRIT
jgi:hypothetical protein